MVTNQTPSQSLMTTWLEYEKQVHLTRKKASAHNIHQLRISTQMFEAVLRLVSGLNSARHTKNLISLIKKVRKSLGSLRDIHVEAKSMQKQEDEKHFGKIKKFSKYFTKKKVAAEKKADLCLEQISLKREKFCVEKLVKKIKKIETVMTRSQIQSKIRQEIKKSVVKLNKRMKNINPDRAKEIHRLRIIVKKLRYKGECLNSLAGESHFDLGNLKAVQSVAGRIQNDSVLLKTLDRFLAKKENRNNSKILKIRKKVADHRVKTISDQFNKLNILKWAN
ncbi:MAG: CHAD domain-containing protein [Bdellovibrionaceae bacterium]|nr:CHAD domain-containing protein [Pseudobdellovibrionaceae bacterium]